MSIDSVLARMTQLQSLFDSATTAAPTGGSADFSATLGAATDATAASDGTGTGTGADSTNAAFAMLPSATGAATASATASALPADVPYGAQITAAAQADGIDPALLAGLIKQESGFNASARSGAGAVGLTQLMPGTAAGLGVTNALDPVQSIQGGAKYLKQMLDRFGGDVQRALAAYNAGPGAVQRFGGVPPYAETQNYVRNVQANAASFRPSSPIA